LLDINAVDGSVTNGDVGVRDVRDVTGCVKVGFDAAAILGVYDGRIGKLYYLLEIYAVKNYHIFFFLTRMFVTLLLDFPPTEPMDKP
jgi:hypothetical protein